MNLLAIKQIDAGYGNKQILFDLSLDVDSGEVVAIIGPNGSGKSTLLKAVFGLVKVWKGEIFYEGNLNNDSSPERNVLRGIGFVPQGGGIFYDLAVKDNLIIGGYYLPKRLIKARIEEILQLFPVLSEFLKHDASVLSSGQQQILALARVLITKPRLIMLDEPSLGLAPTNVTTVFNCVSELNQNCGISILIVEQKVNEVLELCNRVYSFKLGKIAFAGAARELQSDREKLKSLFI